MAHSTQEMIKSFFHFNVMTSSSAWIVELERYVSRRRVYIIYQGGIASKFYSLSLERFACLQGIRLPRTHSRNYFIELSFNRITC